MKLYGKKPIIERVRANPGTIRKMYLQKQTDLSGAVREIKKAGLDFDSVDRNWMKKNCPGANTQGIVAEVDDFTYASYGKVLDSALKGEIVPVFIDGVTDIRNLGAIIRNLACMGGFSVVLPEHDSAGVNETVLRVASGGENYVDIARVVNTSRAVTMAKDRDVCIVGTVAAGGRSLKEAEFNYPLGVIIGAEGKGIRPGLREKMDFGITLPMPGAELSYNVAVATSIFCYEINRDRGLF